MTCKRPPSAPNGFTLVELMVVIAIIGLLASVVTVNVLKRMEVARKTQVRADMETLGTALKFYKLDMNLYPQPRPKRH